MPKEQITILDGLGDGKVPRGGSEATTSGITHPLLPSCRKCKQGDLLPLSDYGQEGSSVMFKAWVCTNPECGWSIRVDKGEVTYGKRVETKRESKY